MDVSLSSEVHRCSAKEGGASRLSRLRFCHVPAACNSSPPTPATARQKAGQAELWCILSDFFFFTVDSFDCFFRFELVGIMWVN